MLRKARWRSGNAAVCRTDIQGFDSLPRLRAVSSLVERFSDKEEADGSIPSRPTLLKFNPLIWYYFHTMSEGGRDKPAPQQGDLLGEGEILTQFPGVLRIAKDRILLAHKNKRGKIDRSRIESSLNDKFDLNHCSTTFTLDDEMDYSVEKVGYLEYMDITLTRFPHRPMAGKGIVSEGIRIRIYKQQGRGESFIEYHLKEKDEAGRPINSPPIKNTPEALRRAIAFASSI